MSHEDIVSCPWCSSSRIAWSHETGYVICQSCGAVLGEIIDESGDDLEPYRYGIWYSNGKPPRPSKLIERVILRALKRGKILVKTKRSLSIDSPANRRAKLLAKTHDNLGNVLKEVESDPILKARTYRSRVAIAYYLILRANGISKYKAIELAASETGVSRRNLENTISKYSSRIRSLEEKIQLQEIT